MKWDHIQGSGIEVPAAAVRKLSDLWHYRRFAAPMADTRSRPPRDEDVQNCGPGARHRPG
jgi:hypothetical protein